MKRLQNMKFTPHLIDRTKEKMTGMPQLKKLVACEPLDPLGWFRFLHDHFLGRNMDEYHGPIRDGVLAKIVRRKPDFGPGHSHAEFIELLSALKNSQSKKT